jgi:hypothetical protein
MTSTDIKTDSTFTLGSLSVPLPSSLPTRAEAEYKPSTVPPLGETEIRRYKKARYILSDTGTASTAASTEASVEQTEEHKIQTEIELELDLAKRLLENMSRQEADRISERELKHKQPAAAPAEGKTTPMSADLYKHAAWVAEQIDQVGKMCTDSKQNYAQLKKLMDDNNSLRQELINTVDAINGDVAIDTDAVMIHWVEKATQFDHKAELSSWSWKPSTDPKDFWIVLEGTKSKPPPKDEKDLPQDECFLPVEVKHDVLYEIGYREHKGRRRVDVSGSSPANQREFHDPAPYVKRHDKKSLPIGYFHFAANERKRATEDIAGNTVEVASMAMGPDFNSIVRTLIFDSEELMAWLLKEFIEMAAYKAAYEAELTAVSQSTK